MSEAGYKIGNKVYPFPARFLLGDPVLVRELTGLEWADFLERLPDADDLEDVTYTEDPVATLGLVGVAIWHGHPTWKRDKVVRYTLALAQGEVTFVAPEVEEPLPEGAPEGAAAAVADDAGPPEIQTSLAGSPTSETPAQPSGSDSAPTSAPSTTPQASGTPQSPAGATA